MSFGLQTFSKTGVLEVDISSRLTKNVGWYTFATTPDSTQNIYIPGITNDGTWGYTNIGNGASVSIIPNYIVIYISVIYNGPNYITVFRY